MAKLTAEALLERTLKKYNNENALAYLSKSYELNRDETYLQAAAGLYSAMIDKPEAFNSAYWGMRGVLFALSGQITRKVQDNILYRKLAPSFFKCSARIAEQLEYKKSIETKDELKRVLILTMQFIDPPHSPTIIASEFAKRLKKIVDMDVRILDSSEYPETAVSSFHPSFCGSVRKQMGEQTIRFDGEDLSVHIMEFRGASVEKMQKGLALIEAFDPDVILTVGDSIMLAEIAAKRWPVLCWPTTQAEAVSTAPVQFYRSATKPDQAIDWKKLKIPEPVFIKQDFDTQQAVKNTHLVTRETLKLDEGAFVFALVGNRIKDEISVDFQKLMIRVLESDPRAHMVIVGTNEFDIIPELAALKSRLRLAKFTSELRSLLGVCDAFLNPPRQGGGNGAYLAMLESLPILTLDNCDVQMSILNDAAVKNLQELEALSIAVMKDANVHADYSAKSKARIATLLDEKTSTDLLIGHLKTTQQEFNRRYAQD